MERVERTSKMGLASLLVVMMLALAGLAVTHTAANGGLATLTSTAQTAAQQATKNDTSAVTNNNATASSSTTTTEQTSAAQQTQQGGVVDATYAVKQAGPAVVTIVNTMQVTTGRGRFGGTQTAEALGSGVIIDSQGYIVTNQHVVANQQSLQVIFADGTNSAATVVGEDAYTDIAVIKVDAKVPAVAKFGDSSKLQPGQPVVAIGTALGDYRNTVTEGIVSGLHRTLSDGTSSTQDLVQTDAAINHGNSGGPLLDLQGNVVGINTAVVRSTGMMGDVAEGLGFAIASNTVQSIVGQLTKNGSVSHPYIGITYQPITPDVATANNLPTQQGIFVTDVASGSPAQKAGIQPGSVITRFDGVDLSGSDSGSTSSTVADLLSKHKVGDSVKLTVIAPGTTTAKDVTVVLAQRPSGQ